MSRGNKTRSSSDFTTNYKPRKLGSGRTGSQERERERESEPIDHSGHGLKHGISNRTAAVLRNIASRCGSDQPSLRAVSGFARASIRTPSGPTAHGRNPSEFRLPTSARSRLPRSKFEPETNTTRRDQPYKSAPGRADRSKHKQSKKPSNCIRILPLQRAARDSHVERS